MAKQSKGWEQYKPHFPSKECPKCSKRIHARSMSHDCGWRALSDYIAKPKPKRKKIERAVVVIKDICAVKGLVDRLGADNVQKLAAMFAE